MLNDFGKLAIAELVFYTPLLLLTLAVTLRYGFDRREGWILLFMFANVRIVGSILLIVSQAQSDPSTGILIAAGIVQLLGLSPLLLSSLAFVSTLVKQGYESLSRPVHFLHLVVTAGVVLGVIGGVKATPDHTQSEQDSGHTFSRVASILFLLAYIAIVALHSLLWMAPDTLSRSYKKFLHITSLALPFLAVRVLYSILGAFIRNPPKFSPTVGDWKINFVMAFMMEYIIACTYIYGGHTTSLRNDAESDGYKQTGFAEELSWRGGKRR